MATCGIAVFGTPIVHGSRAQRAHTAATNQNTDGKHDQVLKGLQHAKKSATVHKKKSPTDGISITSGLFYNATGDPMTIVTTHDWEGHVAGNLPIVIQNGQWASFFHVGEQHRPSSVGAVVYNIQGYTDAMVAWYNPLKSSRGGSNTVYCDMQEPGYFSYCDWNEIFHDLRDSDTHDETTMEAFTTKVSIDKVGNFKAEFYLTAG